MHNTVCATTSSGEVKADIHAHFEEGHLWDIGKTAHNLQIRNEPSVRLQHSAESKLKISDRDGR